MTVKQRFFQLLDNISFDDIDAPLVILLSVIIIILALKFGKKDDGKTIFDGSKHRMETFDKKDDNEGFI